MGNLTLAVLEIYCSLQQWKNCANPPRIDKVIAMVRVATFFDSRCILYRVGRKTLTQSIPMHTCIQCQRLTDRRAERIAVGI